MGCACSRSKPGQDEAKNATSTASTATMPQANEPVKDNKAVKMTDLPSAVPSPMALRDIPIHNDHTRSWEANHELMHTHWAVYASRYVWGIFEWETYVGRTKALLDLEPAWVLAKRINPAFKAHMDRLKTENLDQRGNGDLIPFRNDPHIKYDVAEMAMYKDLGGTF